jgi:hypothetical protein
MGILKSAYKYTWVKWAWLSALVLVPIILWILPGDYFDQGDTIVCPSKRFLDIECLGCGMTRAVMHLHNFQFTDAIFFNYLVVILKYFQAYFTYNI